MIHLGINAPTLTSRGQPKSVVDELVARIEELGVQLVRVPLPWRMLDDGTDSLVFDDRQAARVEQALERLDPSVRILGILTKPPESEAVRYFDERHRFGARFATYVEYCAARFERVDEWEVWNEPNASDFYLSIAQADDHRPWSAEEFLEDAYLPAVAVLRRDRPGSPVCLGAVAENGIVGHRDRSPALSNLLPGNPRFGSLRRKGKHGSFYFNPDFTPALMEGVARLSGAERPDAVALHPYPYFELEPGTGLVEHSTELARDFLSHVPEGLPVWITEVGARSLVIPIPYRRDDDQQAEFLEHFPHHVELPRQPTRVYWYKVVDRIRDLRMEKTFGLLDLGGSPRRAFFTFKRMELTRGPHPALVDRFEWGMRHSTDVLDPSLWDVEATSPYAFADHVPIEGRSTALISPGREEGDRWGARSRYPVALADGDGLEVSLTASFEGPPRSVIIALMVGSASVEFLLDTDRGVVESGEASQPLPDPIDEFALAVNVSGDSMAARATFGGEDTLESEQPLDAPQGAVTVGFAIRKTTSAKGFVRLHRFEARRLAGAGHGTPGGADDGG